MANPLRSEGAAFNFVLLAIGFFAAIVIATAVLGSWAGLVVFLGTCRGRGLVDIPRAVGADADGGGLAPPQS